MSPLHDIQTPAPRVQIQYDFISPAEEAYLSQKVATAGGDSSKRWGWTDLNGRRSMYWGGSLTPSGALVPAPMPPFMSEAWPNVLQRINETGVFGGKGKAPNHCLVNEYLPGQGILAHTDGPAYAPVVATLSLMTHTILKLKPRPVSDTTDADYSSKPAVIGSDLTTELSIFLPPRSLVVLTDEIYSNWLHSIEPVKVDSTEELMACANWEDWWENGGDLSSLALERVPEGDAAAAEGTQDSSTTTASRKEALIKEVVARRRIAEQLGKGWERGTRLSLTCRSVDKVRTLRIG